MQSIGVPVPLLHHNAASRTPNSRALHPALRPEGLEHPRAAAAAGAVAVRQAPAGGCEDVEGEALPRWSSTRSAHRQGCAVKAPGFGDRARRCCRTWHPHGARSCRKSPFAQTARLEDLGKARRCHRKENTTIITAPQEQGHQGPVEQIKRDRGTTSDYDREKLRSASPALRRFSVIRFGAATEIDMKERGPCRRRVARHACRVEEGVVPCGGVARFVPATCEGPKGVTTTRLRHQHPRRALEERPPDRDQCRETARWS